MRIHSGLVDGVPAGERAPAVMWVTRSSECAAQVTSQVICRQGVAPGSGSDSGPPIPRTWQHLEPLAFAPFLLGIDLLTSLRAFGRVDDQDKHTGMCEQTNGKSRSCCIHPRIPPVAGQVDVKQRVVRPSSPDHTFLGCNHPMPPTCPSHRIGRAEKLLSA